MECYRASCSHHGSHKVMHHKFVMNVTGSKHEPELWFLIIISPKMDMGSTATKINVAENKEVVIISNK